MRIDLNLPSDVGGNTGQTVDNSDSIIDMAKLNAASFDLTLHGVSNVGSNARQSISNADSIVDVAELDATSLKVTLLSSTERKRDFS